MDVKMMEKKFGKKLIYPLLTIIIFFLGVDNFTALDFGNRLVEEQPRTVEVVEGDYYDSAQEVVEYLHAYDELPGNYLTKKEARDLGWVSNDGNLWDVAPGTSIGGDYFGNYEGLLPEEDGRDYREADINYKGGYRDGERLVFSNDGLYFYTDDHYESFDEMKPVGEAE